MQENAQRGTKKIVSRTPIVFSRPQPRSGFSSIQNCSKTKSVICFLCIFDGLRTPSVRRLVRKPRTICQKPLLTFDPYYYAPASKNGVQEIYNNAVHCPCDMVVDPSAQTAIQLIKKHSSSMPPQRIILHYFGHGCHPPTDDGSLYFFSEDRARYKAIKISSILNSCAQPVCAIIDAPSAGSLYRYFTQKPDIFAFFACSSGESLPLSTDAPLDLFSSCLLTPYETALWFHKRHHSSVLTAENNAADNAPDHMKKFLDAVLESILFDSQSPQNFDKFSKDPAVFTLFKGFALAQRILTSFNIHCLSFPEVRNMCSHPLWGILDIALDCSLAMPPHKSEEMIFKVFSTSFDSFPSTSAFPILSYYLKTDFHHEAVTRLLKFIDSTEGAASTAAKSNVPSVIVGLDKPSATSLIVLSKIIAASQTSPFDQQVPISFTSSKDFGTLRAGMCSICCSIAAQANVSFNRLSQLCLERAVPCAPFSALLLSLLIDKAGRLMNIAPFNEKFAPLLKSKKQEVRASAVLLFGESKEANTLSLLIPFLKDNSALVRCQAVWSVCKQMRFEGTTQPLELIKSMKDDKDVSVRSAVETLVPFFEEEELLQESLPQNQILIQLLMNSVNSTGFIERFEGDLFMIDSNR